MEPPTEPTSTWSSNFKMNLAILSYATGFNIPKVASPWLLRTRIGILFLIPVQLLVASVVTIPCVFMELALGQYSNKAIIRIWDLCPVSRGIGICSFITFVLYQIYYTFLCSCTLCFMFLSLSSEPHWKSCNKSWNRINCYNLRDNYTRRMECYNKYSKEKCDKMQWQSSVEQFYFNRILNLDETSEYVGAPQQELLFYFFVTLVLVFLANYDGPKFSEKFLVFLAIIPTVQLLILFFAPLTDYNGFVTLNYLFTRFDKTLLGDFKTWITIVDLSLSIPGLGFGAYITFGTHSSFRSPIHLKAIVTSLVSVLFSILYSITLQNFLISLCLQSKMLLEDFFNLEHELPMPEAVFFLEHSSRFWMTMWLSNSYMLGLRSLIVMMTLNAEMIYNSFPDARMRHSTCVFFFSIFIYIGGIFLSTRIGFLVVKAIDRVINQYSILFINIFQLVVVMFIYGIKKFRDDVYFMLGIKTSGYFNAFYIVNPFFLGLVLIYSVYNFYTNATNYQFRWSYVLENFLLWFSPGLICIFAITYLAGALTNSDIAILKPSNEWKPRIPELVKSRKIFKTYNMAKEYLYRRERFGEEFGEGEL